VNLPTRDIELIRQWATRTNAVRKVWLFGSRGKGIASPDSDIDIAIYLMPPAPGKADWALALYHSDEGDAWQRELGAMLGSTREPGNDDRRHPKEIEVLAGKQIWTRS
jgi:predicted nucleotidyltransferase